MATFCHLMLTALLLPQSDVPQYVINNWPKVVSPVLLCPPGIFSFYTAIGLRCQITLSDESHGTIATVILCLVPFLSLAYYFLGMLLPLTGVPIGVSNIAVMALANFGLILPRTLPAEVPEEKKVPAGTSACSAEGGMPIGVPSMAIE